MNIQPRRQLKILLIGDSCTDVYVIGKCERLSPEAPVPVFLKISEYEVDGMSANVYENIKNMTSAEITYLSNPKKDITKTRFIDNKTKQHVLRYDVENSITPLDCGKLPNQEFDAVIISDYNKGYINDVIAKKIVDKYSCTIFVDTKKTNLECYAGCVVKLNENEASVAKNIDKVTLIETLGNRGAKFAGHSYPVNAVEVHDVSGAGDVFLAALVANWLNQKDIIASIRLANTIAAFSVTKSGTYVVKRDEYERIKKK